MQEKITTKKEARCLVGKVISDKMNKTIVVEVKRTFLDDRLHKIMRTAKKYKVHDENEEAAEGDFVEIREGRPRSKTKYMYLSKVIEQLNK